MKVFEEVSGLSLEGYFEQAFFKAGHPEFEVSFSWDEETRTAEVAVKQTQQLDELTPDLLAALRAGLLRAGARAAAEQARQGGSAPRPGGEVPLRAPREADHRGVRPRGVAAQEGEVREAGVDAAQPARESRDASSRRRAAEGLSSFKNDPGVVRGAREGGQRGERPLLGEVRGGEVAGEDGGKQALDGADEALKGQAQAGSGARSSRRSGEFKDAAVSEPLLAALRGDESPYVQCQAALSYAKAGLKDAYDGAHLRGRDALPGGRDQRGLPRGARVRQGAADDGSSSETTFRTGSRSAHGWGR